MFHIEIEPTNLCNTRCLHCPHESILRPSGKMDWETYQAVIDKVAAYAPEFSVEYAGMGEPLLNPLIYQFVAYASPKAITSITTNASALTENNLQHLIEAGLHNLTISFNGADPGLYELMMGGLRFDRAQKALQTALDLSAGTNLKISANVSVTKQTQPHLAQIRQYLQEAGVQTIYFSKCHSRGGFLKGTAVCDTPMPPVDESRCDIFTNTLFIAWTGEVLSCCHDLGGDNILGDLKTESLGNLLEQKANTAAGGVRFEICKSCNDLFRFMEDHTADGRMASEWIYELYTQKTGSELASAAPAAGPQAQVSSLTKWLYQVYAQEGQSEALFERLSAQLEQKVIELQSLQVQLKDIEDSRSWRLMRRLQKLRLQLIPVGSRREKWFGRALKRLGW